MTESEEKPKESAADLPPLSAAPASGGDASALPLPPPPRYGIANVIAAVLVFFALTSLFCARSLYNWASHLPASETSSTLKKLTEAYWSATAELGVEGPELALERASLSLQEASPLLYPKAYADRNKPRRSAAKPKLAKADKEILEQEAAAGLDHAKGPKTLVLGDSIMMTVGPEIKRAIVSRLSGAAVVKARLATGLARPDVFDWVKELQRSTVSRKYDYIVLMLGTNDSQDFTEDGTILTYGTAEWVKVYTKRMSALMDATCKGARHGLWIGLPPMRKAAFNHKATRINNWARHAVEKHACMQYLALDDVLGDEHGKFTSYLEVDDHREKVRMVDGIHVNGKGGEIIAEALMGLMVDGSAVAGTGTLSSH